MLVAVIRSAHVGKLVRDRRETFLPYLHLCMATQLEHVAITSTTDYRADRRGTSRNPIDFRSLYDKPSAPQSGWF